MASQQGRLTRRLRARLAGLDGKGRAELLALAAAAAVCLGMLLVSASHITEALAQQHAAELEYGGLQGQFALNAHGSEAAAGGGAAGAGGAQAGPAEGSAIDAIEGNEWAAPAADEAGAASGWAALASRAVSDGAVLASGAVSGGAASASGPAHTGGASTAADGASAAAGGGSAGGSAAAAGRASAAAGGSTAAASASATPTSPAPAKPLWEINPDYVGWLTVPGTVIDYPVARGADNALYLNTTFAGRANPAGSIFMDCRSMAGFASKHAILYGHNLKSGKMFGSLKKYLDPSFLAQNPVVAVTMPDGSRHDYIIFSARATTAWDEAYRLSFADEADFSSFAAALGAPEGTTRLLTLSTCTDGGDDYERLLIHAALAPTQVY